MTSWIIIKYDLLNYLLLERYLSQHRDRDGLSSRNYVAIAPCDRNNYEEQTAPYDYLSSSNIDGMEIQNYDNDVDDLLE